MNIQNQEQWNAAFIEACQNGNHEELRHLCQKQYLAKGWANVHAYNEEGFRWACENGHLDVVKYLLTSRELKESGHEWANLNAKDDYGFRGACANGQLKVVKYLLTSPELKEAGHTWADVHAENDEGFRWACRYNQWDLLRWLVMDYGLEKTSDIKNIIKDYPQAQEYFRVREEMSDLDRAMNPSLNHGLLKGIQSKVDSFVQVIKNMSGLWGFNKEQRARGIKNAVEVSNEHEKSKQDEGVKHKPKRL